MEWKPSSASVACNIGQHCSNSQPKQQPTYTFGHGTKVVGQNPETASEDKAALWWEDRGTHKPTTNDARNSDVAEFWQTSKGQAAEAIQNLTGKAIAKKVKEAGRGTHVTLGVEGDEFTRTSRYKQEFCEKFSPEQQQAVKADVENKFLEAKRQAIANKALGRGSSVTLSYMW